MTNKTQIPEIDYTSRDFLSIRDDMIRRIPYFAPEWTNFNASDPGVALIEVFSMALDVLHFYIDKMAAEGFLDTAIAKSSVINLLKLIDYRIPGPTAATADVLFTMDSVKSIPVLIPKNTLLQTVPQVPTEEPIFFETLQDVTIPVGQISATVGVEEGQTFEENFSSNGQAFQKFELTRFPVLENTIQVFVTETIEEKWQVVNSFSEASGTDKIYVVSFDADNKAFIEFGDNGQGKIPINNANIRVVYKVGGGSKGNVGANTITSLVSSITAGGNPVNFTVTNPNPATGGSDGQTIEEAKIQGPLTLRALNRAVTLDDIATLAKNVSGVGKTKAVQAEPIILREIYLYVAPAGGGVPSNTLLNNVKTALEPVKMAGTVITPLPPKYVKFLVKGNIVVKPNFIQNDVKSSVESAINDFFDFNSSNVDFGKSVHLSDFLALIDNVNGVDYVDLEFAHFDPLDTVELEIWSGDSFFDSITLNSLAKDEIISINFISNTQFQVTGSISGIQSSIGIVGNDFIMDNQEVKFRIAAGTIQNKVGDRATFRSMKVLGNVILKDNEIIQKGTIDLTYSGGA